MEEGVPPPLSTAMNGLEINISISESTKDDCRYSIEINLHGRRWSLLRTYSQFKAFHLASNSARGGNGESFPASHKHTTVFFLEEYIANLFCLAYAPQSSNAAAGDEQQTVDVASSLMDFLDDEVDGSSGAGDAASTPSSPREGKKSALSSTLLKQVTHLTSKIATYEDQFEKLNARLKELENERTGRRERRDSDVADEFADDASQDRSGVGSSPGRRHRSDSPTPEEFFRGPDDLPQLEAIEHTYASSTLLPLACIPTNTQPAACDAQLEQIMTLFLPQEPQKKYRDSALAHAARHVKRELRGTTYEISLGAVSCFLPDDPIRLSVLVRRTQATSWHENLAFRLQSVSKDPNMTLFTGGSRMSDRTGDDNDDEEEEEELPNVHLPGVTHVLSSLRVDARPKGCSSGFQGEVAAMPAAGSCAPNGNSHGMHGLHHHNHNSSFVSSPGSQGPYGMPPQPASTGTAPEYQLSYKLDGLNDVSIIATGREDLCLLAFVEEFAATIGKDDLFKRSLCLIRAWFLYEGRHYDNRTDASGPNPLRGFLTEDAFAVLVVAIFNVHAGLIHTPLQALCVFLAEYAGLDWANVCVTIQGVVPFRMDLGEGADEGAEDGAGVGIATGAGFELGQLIPHVVSPQEGHVVKPAMAMRYWELFNLTGQFGNGAKKRRPEDEEGLDEEGQRREGSVVSYGPGSSVGNNIPGQRDSGRRSSLTTHATNRSDVGSEKGNLTHRSAISGALSDDASSVADSGSSRAPHGRVDVTPSSLASLAASKEVEPVILPHQAVRSFDRREVNILHPLSYGNMFRNDGVALAGNLIAVVSGRGAVPTGDKFTAVKFSRVLALGASQLAKLLQGADVAADSAAPGPSAGSVASPGGTSVTLTAFFEHTIKLYSQGYRPDVIGNRLWVLTYHILGLGANERDKEDKARSGRPTSANLATNRDSSVSRSSQRDSVSSTASLSSRRDSVRESAVSLGSGRRDSTTSQASSSSTSSGSREASAYRGLTHQALWDLVLYCNLVWEQRITETALLKSSMDILTERGTLPVGEIGKTLQELASMTIISGKLKESFGGLKKFLEVRRRPPFTRHLCILLFLAPHPFASQSLTPSPLHPLSPDVPRRLCHLHGPPLQPARLPPQDAERR